MTYKDEAKFHSVLSRCLEDFIYPMFEAVIKDSDIETVEATMAALADGLAKLGLAARLPKDGVVRAFAQTIDVVYEQNLEEEELH